MGRDCGHNEEWVRAIPRCASRQERERNSFRLCPFPPSVLRSPPRSPDDGFCHRYIGVAPFDIYRASEVAAAILWLGVALATGL